MTRDGWPPDMTRDDAIRDAPRGWRPLVGLLYSDLLALGWNGQLHQVKQKLGELRFYTNTLTPDQAARVRLAEAESSRTCEVCGGIARQVARGGWLSALCPMHAADPRPAWIQAGTL